MAEHLTEFQRLQRKATSSFEAIRDLAHNDERAFTNAFRSFQSLWIYQQEHRQALVQAGLKRAEIGEISSKIGQLNYTFYQRCADTRFLIEAYVFYEAIRLRQYFEGEPSSSNATIKRLRFNARFIVVCLLLNKKEEACSLMLEFQAHINLTPDAQGWQCLVDEVSQFLAADVGMPLPRSPGLDIPFKLNLRCCANGLLQGAGAHAPRISHAVIVSYMHQQVKIAELPLDMFRMMQTLEWSNSTLEQHGRDEEGSMAASLESGGSASPAGIAAAAAAAIAAASQATPLLPCANPRKTTLYRSTAPQLLSILHSQAAAQGARADSVLLLILCVGSLRSQVGEAPASELQQQLQQQQRSSGGQNSLGSGGPSVHGSSASLVALQHGLPPAAVAVAAAALSDSCSTASISNSLDRNTSLPAAVACQLVGGQGCCPALHQPDISSALCLSPLPSLPPSPAASGEQHTQGELLQQGGQGAREAPTGSAAEAVNQPPPQQLPQGSRGAAPHGPLTCCMEHLLLPQDLLPLTRRRLMLVVDSDAAGFMTSLSGKEQGYPVVALLSPSHRPSAFGDHRKTGSLLTMFLSAPVMALCLSMGVLGPSTQQLTALQDAVEHVLHEVAVALQQALLPSWSGGTERQGSPACAGAWVLPFQDLMLRQYMTRFVLARGVWAFHRASVGRPECQAACFPPLPPEVDARSALVRRMVLRLARVLDRQALFTAAQQQHLQHQPPPPPPQQQQQHVGGKTLDEAVGEGVASLSLSS